VPVLDGGVNGRVDLGAREVVGAVSELREVRARHRARAVAQEPDELGVPLRAIRAGARLAVRLGFVSIGRVSVVVCRVSVTDGRIRLVVIHISVPISIASVVVILADPAVGYVSVAVGHVVIRLVPVEFDVGDRGFDGDGRGVVVLGVVVAVEGIEQRVDDAREGVPTGRTEDEAARTAWNGIGDDLVDAVGGFLAEVTAVEFAHTRRVGCEGLRWCVPRIAANAAGTLTFLRAALRGARMSDIPETMDAQVIREHGDPDVFEHAELDVPEVDANEVLIEVAATSVNPVDTKIRSGFASDLCPDFPAVLHGDLAGEVVAVGDGVDEFAVGDEVYGCPGGLAGTTGALAEYAAADAATLAHKPDSLSMREAAALPLVAITAWDGLVTRADVSPGESVLVHGGTGGVGHVGVQIASLEGGVVHATASTEEKRSLARDLGADHTFDYRRDVDDYVAEYTDGEGFDVVFDTVGAGADNLENDFAAASVKGRVVTTVSRGEADLNPVHSKGLSFDTVFMLLPLIHDDHAGRLRHGEILARVATLVDAGDIVPHLDDTDYVLDEVGEAHRRLESGNHVGKITVRVKD